MPCPPDNNDEIVEFTLRARDVLVAENTLWYPPYQRSTVIGAILTMLAAAPINSAELHSYQPRCLKIVR